MPKQATKRIFEKQRLGPRQLRTVADRRFGDARALADMRKNERANGAMYLGGFVLECLLKAELVSTYAWLQTTGHPQNLSKENQRIWSLCYRSHDLDEILAVLPHVEARIRAHDHGTGRPVFLMLKEICSFWTILARYSPLSTDHSEATAFMAQIKEIKECLSRAG